MSNIDKIPVEYNESCIEPPLRKGLANGLCVEPTDQRALSDRIAFLNVHYDQSVRFCTGTERSADSMEWNGWLRRRKVVGGGGGGGGGWWLWRVEVAEGGGGRGVGGGGWRCILTVSSLYHHCILTVSLQREVSAGAEGGGWWWWRRWRIVVVEAGGGRGWWRRRMVEAGVALYPHCILTVSSLYPSKERCLRSPAAGEGGGWCVVTVASEGDGGRGWRRRRVALYPHCILTVSPLYPHCIPPKRGVCGGKEGGGGGKMRRRRKEEKGRIGKRRRNEEEEEENV